MDPSYKFFTTPIVPQGQPFPGEHLHVVARQGYNSVTHEPLRRFATEEFARKRTTWWAFRRTGDDEMEDSASDEEDDGDEDVFEYLDIDDPRDNRLDDHDMRAIRYDWHPLPNLPDEPLIMPSVHGARLAFSTSNTAIQLEEGMEDDADLLLEEKVFAVGLLYKAIISMPVRVGLDTPDGLEDVRTAKVNEMVNFLAQDPVNDTHQRLSSLAALVLLHILKLHGEGYVVNIPNRRRSSDRRLTASQRLETLLSYLSDMKSLVLKCLQEGENGVAEVVAFPKTIFEQHLNAQVADSADEEEAEDSNDIDDQETAAVQATNPGSSAPLTQAQVSTTTRNAQDVLPASTSAISTSTTESTTAGPSAVQAGTKPVGGWRRRVKPRLPSNF